MPLRNRWLSARVLSTLPLFFSVSVAAWAVWYWQQPQLNMPLVLGIIAGGLVDLDNRLTGRIKNVVITVAAFTVSSLAVQLTFGHPWLFGAVMTGLTFVFTLAGAIGLRYRTIAFGTLVVALYTVLTHHEQTVWYVNPLLILCGTLLYSASTLLLHLLFPHRPVQNSMASAYTALAAYLDAKSVFFDPDETETLEQQQIALAMQNAKVVAAFNLVRSALFYRLRGQHRHPRTTRMLHYYFAAQDIHERISSSHVEYHSFVENLRHSDLIFRIQRLLEWQAQTCRDVAHSLRRDGPLPDTQRLERVMAGVRQSLRLHMERHPDSRSEHGLHRLLDNLQSVNYQLTHLGNADVDAEYGDNSERNRIAGEDVRGWRSVGRTVAAHLSLESPVFRHAVRLAMVVSVCIALIESLHLPLGYWILLTAVFVCQPNYSATKSRLKQRVVGTLAGVLVGSLVPYFTPSLETRLAVVVVSSTLFFFFRTNKYSYSTFFITIQAVVSFSIAGLDVAEALPLRLLDTVIGAGISWLAVSFLWPDWHYLGLERTGAQALRSSAGYLNSILDQLRHGGADDVAYRSVRRRAHEHAAQLSSTLSDMSGEPAKYGDQLQNGFILLKTNYALIGYISALGAYRSQMPADSRDETFLPDFFRAAAQTAALLRRLPELPPEDFAGQAEALRGSLLALRPADDERQNSILWQQLNRIARLLPTAYQALHDAGRTESPPQNPLPRSDSML
ncbi:YccS family putative transporter [Neisseria shayeganii]|uniref:TIGR01666 family membrane protein n=1 Tax=Neisseria shayeganii TaxID=607712 RepID=A0A7D7NBR4_9NEIS|nr:YccS family putative transporter [Neisseria shayeganii]QMT40418.1 TIGR01666 family membrane protein [Neisseria shayeganii]